MAFLLPSPPLFFSLFSIERKHTLIAGIQLEARFPKLARVWARSTHRPNRELCILEDRCRLPAQPRRNRLRPRDNREERPCWATAAWARPTTSGRSNIVPRSVGFLISSAAIKVPEAPPTSTTIFAEDGSSRRAISSATYRDETDIAPVNAPSASTIFISSSVAA